MYTGGDGCQRQEEKSCSPKHAQIDAPILSLNPAIPSHPSGLFRRLSLFFDEAKLGGRPRALCSYFSGIRNQCICPIPGRSHSQRRRNMHHCVNKSGVLIPQTPEDCPQGRAEHRHADTVVAEKMWRPYDDRIVASSV